MLTPRLSVAPSLAFYSFLGFVAVAGVWGCQGPDTFLRSGIGAGGSPSGFGGFNAVGVGGHGTGGMTGVGGMGVGGAGTGGAAGTGGRGTGGTAAGGAPGTGGAGVGGRPGTGGARDGGIETPGVGGMIGTGGAPGVDGGADADGGLVGGTGPCMGLCANPIVLPGNSVGSTNQGNGATCYEATGTFGGGNCGNFVAPRTFSINGVVVPACTTPNGNGGGNFTLPATRVNGGYCFQSSPGEFPYAYFGLF